MWVHCLNSMPYKDDFHYHGVAGNLFVEGIQLSRQKKAGAKRGEKTIQEQYKFVPNSSIFPTFVFIEQPTP